MPTTFITWSEKIDADFRVRYAEIVGEDIQDRPPVIDGLFVVGSSRITPEHAAKLCDIFPEIIIQEKHPDAIKTEIAEADKDRAMAMEIEESDDL